MRLALSAGYYGSWIITAALLLFAPIALFWGMANFSQLTGIDDDVTLLALPMGGALGAWVAVRTRLAVTIHRVLAILGVCLIVSGIALAAWFMQRSQQASGSGPFAGFGELVVAGTSIGIAALGACMFGIWAFAKLAGLHDVGEPRIEPISTSDTMNETPSSLVASTFILLILFFGGGFVGEQLALALAPGSGVSRLLGFLALPASFILGFFVWAGAAALTSLGQLAKSRPHPGQKPRDIPPGAIGFLWSSLLSCLFVGLITGLLSNEYGVVFVSGVYAATGLVFGGVCWRLAKSGWLPFPRE